LLRENAAGQQEIITQEHRDSVIDELMQGEFIKSFGIDYTTENV
jgi:hypothetical protein